MPAVLRPPRRRQIMLFCDGTSNTLTARRRDSNVLRLHAHVAAHSGKRDAPPRLLYYDPGVGGPDGAPATDPLDALQRRTARLFARASARGIYDNIAQAYVFLMRNWSGPRDRICLFGFSRGAFTVRSVAGMVHLFGVVRPEHEALVPTLIRVYFSQPHDQPAQGALAALTRRWHARHGAAGATRSAMAEQVRQQFCSPAGRSAWVDWVGVWETVESVGLPGPLSRRIPTTATLQDKRIRHVRQALAFDEHRSTFAPRLYDEPGDIDTPERTLRQRWFPGAHADVGGGYAMEDAGLSDATLRWMVGELGESLALPALPPSPARSVRHDRLYDTPAWALAGMTLRDMQPRTRPHSTATPAVSLPIAVVPGPVDDGAIDSVWTQRRPLPPLLWAAGVGLLLLTLSGYALLPQAALDTDGWLDAIDATMLQAWEQLAALWGGGLFEDGRAPWARRGQPGWAMVYDLGFIVCWGYVLARIASRAFAWLAGTRGPESTLPAWRRLGLMPLAAVAGDAGEDLLLLLALAAHAAAAGHAAALALWLGGVAALVKWAGFAGSAMLVAARWCVALAPRDAFASREVLLGRHVRTVDETPTPLDALAASDTPMTARSSAAFVWACLSAATALLLVWLFARMTVCWGTHGVLAAIVCHLHYAAGLLLAAAGVLLFAFFHHLPKPDGFVRGWWRLDRRTFWSVTVALPALLALLAACDWLLFDSPLRF